MLVPGGENVRLNWVSLEAFVTFARVYFDFLTSGRPIHEFKPDATIDQAQLTAKFRAKTVIKPLWPYSLWPLTLQSTPRPL